MLRRTGSSSQPASQPASLQRAVVCAPGELHGGLGGSITSSSSSSNSSSAAAQCVVAEEASEE
uniref:Uncharacterized protein n=1 Tax=Anopheles dirus TaxID=7168 RepID=A0A182NW28_9DIPT